MARYKPYDYDQLVMVPLSLENQLVPGTLEHTIHYLVENRLDLRVFDERYQNDETGRTAYDPRVLLKIVLLGYSRGLLSSRKLERACGENVIFMALACGQTPDHSTLAAFISEMGDDQIEQLFTQVLLVCEEEGLLGGTHFSIDGLKLSSNASKEWSGTHADLAKKKEKLQERVRQAVREHKAMDRKDHEGRDLGAKRIERLKQKAERVEQFLEENDPKQGRSGKEIQSNITDIESSKMKTSHGIVQGYNANAMVDEKHQVVVEAEAFGEGDDATNAGPMIRGAKENLAVLEDGLERFKNAAITADTSYFSVENLETCRDEEVNAYIPDRLFRKRDPRFADAQRHRRPTDRHKQEHKSKKRWFTVDDFRFDDRAGKLICPAGVALYKNGTNNETQDGYLTSAYIAPKKACASCKLRSKCLRNPDSPSGRQVRIFHGRRPGSLADEMKAKIDTPEGRKTYSKRMGIVEPVFGNLRAQKGMNRFTLRTRKKVNIQWKLYCMIQNLEKVAHYGSSWN